MEELFINPSTFKQAGANVTDLAARIRATSGEDETRSFCNQLASTNLRGAAESAAKALVKARDAFVKRFNQHAQALTEAAKALEEQDASAAQGFRKAKVGRYGPTIQ